MKTFTDLPVEILEIIASNLPIQSYCNLRETFTKAAKLSKLAILNFKAYKESVRGWTAENGRKYEKLLSWTDFDAAEQIVTEKDLRFNDHVKLAIKSYTPSAFAWICYTIIKPEWLRMMRHDLSILNKVASDDREMCELTSLSMACETAGNADIVKLLITDFKVDPSMCSNNFVITAAKMGNLDVVEILLKDSRVDPSAKNNDAILAAAINGHLAIVRLLLQDSRVDPSADNNHAIRSASNYGYLEVIRLLLQDSRVDPSSKNNEAICSASFQGHSKVLQLLLQDSRVNPAARGNAPIRMASAKGRTEAVRLLLKDSRVDPSAKNNKALDEAISKGFTDIVTLLLKDSRVDPSANAILKAGILGRNSIVQLLLQDSRVRLSDHQKKMLENWKILHLFLDELD